MINVYLALMEIYEGTSRKEEARHGQQTGAGAKEKKKRRKPDDALLLWRKDPPQQRKVWVRQPGRAAPKVHNPQGLDYYQVALGAKLQLGGQDLMRWDGDRLGLGSWDPRGDAGTRGWGHNVQESPARMG